jgi:integrase
VAQYWLQIVAHFALQFNICDINNGIFEAQTVEQHQALMNHLHLLESCGRLKPKTTNTPSQSTGTVHMEPLTTSTAQISKEDLMEELIREVKLKYHGGLPLDLMSALHLYCTYMDREPSVDEISRIKKLTVFLADRQLHEYSYDDFLIYQNDEIKRLNPRTIDERLALVRRIYSKLISRGAYKGENPLESWKPSISVHSRKSKAKEDIASIERVVSVYGSSEFAEFGTTHKSFYLIMMIATVTGMRISSICRLTSQDLIESFDGIHVISIAGDKTKAGTRLVPLPSVLFETVKKYLNENRTFDIKCRGTKGFSDAIKKLKDEFFSLNSGFNKEQLNPHGLRASLNNYLIASEVDEAYRCSLLGHKITSPNNKYYGVPITSSILLGGLKGTQELILKKLNFDPSLIFDNCKQNSIIKKPLTILM